MGPVSALIEIDVPRERAFAAIADLSRRHGFTDHFQEEFRLTRIDPRGVGAGARFRLRQPLRSVWEDTTITELEPPHRVVERGSGGRLNRIPTRTVWELEDGPGALFTLRVSHWTEPPGHLDRALESLSGAARRRERGWREALRRLRDQLEADARRAEPVGVAGGNRHATGIP